MNKDKLVQSVGFQKPKIPMDNWVVVKEKEPQANCRSFLLHISEECLETDYKDSESGTQW